MSPSDDRIEFGWEHRGDARALVSYEADDQIEFGLGGDRPGSLAAASIAALARSRALAVALALIAALGLGVAAAGRLTVADPPARSPAARWDGLTDDQSACFAFALVQRRTDLLLGPHPPRGVGPTAQVMRDEITALDRLTAGYRTADYRLLSSFADVADQSVRLLGVQGRPAAADIAADWRSATHSAGDACWRYGAFDVIAVRPVDPRAAGL